MLLRKPTARHCILFFSAPTKHKHEPLLEIKRLHCFCDFLSSALPLLHSRPKEYMSH